MAMRKQHPTAVVAAVATTAVGAPGPRTIATIVAVVVDVRQEVDATAHCVVDPRTGSGRGVMTIATATAPDTMSTPGVAHSTVGNRVARAIVRTMDARIDSMTIARARARNIGRRDHPKMIRTDKNIF